MTKKADKKERNIEKTEDMAMKKTLIFLVDQGLGRCGFKDGDVTISEEDADRVLMEIGRITYILYSEIVMGVRAKPEDVQSEPAEDGSNGQDTA